MLKGCFYESRSQYEYRLAACVWLGCDCPSGTVLSRDTITPELRLMLALCSIASGRRLCKLIRDTLERDYWVQVIRIIEFDQRFDASLAPYYAQRLQLSYDLEAQVIRSQQLAEDFY